MIDIGVNLTEEQFQGKELAVLQRAKEAAIQKMILTGSSVGGSKRSLEMAKRHPGILYSTAGVHPHDAKSYTEQSTKDLKQLLAQPEVIAIGECGLDFDRNYSEPADQYYAFEAQLQIAEEIDLPIFLHERAAHKEFLQVMKQHERLIEKSVVHCFTGDKEQLKAYLDAGFYIGVTGWVCDMKRGMDLREALAYMPLNRLMIETDAPYLLPKNLKPKPKSRINEPMYLPHIGREIAALMQVEEHHFFETVQKNTEKFFRL
ncbi:MAG: TatD family hydrolase [Kurthia sp.]|nr:TatD family hydrolase [Candidatus Kurthia equi]